MDAKLQRKLTANSDAFLPAADYIAKWHWTVDANGTVPFYEITPREFVNTAW
jgi:hypothetical protein